MSELITQYSSRGGKHLTKNELDNLVEETAYSFKHRKKLLNVCCVAMTGDSCVVVIKDKDHGWTAIVTQNFKEVAPK